MLMLRPVPTKLSPQPPVNQSMVWPAGTSPLSVVLPPGQTVFGEACTSVGTGSPAGGTSWKLASEMSKKTLLTASTLMRAALLVMEGRSTDSDPSLGVLAARTI